MATRMIFSPPLPSGDDGVRVHLGCGDIDAPGFTNVDLIPLPHVHFLHSVVDLPMFGPEEVDLIYACHVLEHLAPARAARALREWRRVLKPGGCCTISVPDFDRLIVIYHASGGDIRKILGPLVGSEGLNSHRSVYTKSELERVLLDAGFSEVRPWLPEEKAWYTFRDWASARVDIEGESYPLSLNLEAIR